MFVFLCLYRTPPQQFAVCGRGELVTSWLIHIRNSEGSKHGTRYFMNLPCETELTPAISLHLVSSLLKQRHLLDKPANHVSPRVFLIETRTSVIVSDAFAPSLPEVGVYNYLFADILGKCLLHVHSIYSFRPYVCFMSFLLCCELVVSWRFIARSS